MGEAQQKAALREAMGDADKLMLTCALSLTDIAALSSAGEAILNMAKKQGRDGSTSARALAAAVEKLDMVMAAIELISNPVEGSA